MESLTIEQCEHLINGALAHFSFAWEKAGIKCKGMITEYEEGPDYKKVYIHVSIRERQSFPIVQKGYYTVSENSRRDCYNQILFEMLNNGLSKQYESFIMLRRDERKRTTKFSESHIKSEWPMYSSEWFTGKKV